MRSGIHIEKSRTLSTSICEELPSMEQDAYDLLDFYLPLRMEEEIWGMGETNWSCLYDRYHFWV